MHEKLTKFPNFTSYMPEKINKMPEFYTIFARKIFFPIFLRGGRASASLPPCPTPTVNGQFCIFFVFVFIVEEKPISFKLYFNDSKTAVTCKIKQKNMFYFTRNTGLNDIFACIFSETGFE